MFSSQLHMHLDDKKQWLFVKWLYLQLAAQKLNQKRGWTYRCCICLARWILLPLWWSHKDRADRRLGWSGPCRSRADTVHRYPSQTAPDPLGIQLKTKQCTYKFSCLLQLLPTLFIQTQWDKKGTHPDTAPVRWLLPEGSPDHWGKSGTSCSQTIPGNNPGGNSYRHWSHPLHIVRLDRWLRERNQDHNERE